MLLKANGTEENNKPINCQRDDEKKTIQIICSYKKWKEASIQIGFKREALQMII